LVDDLKMAAINGRFPHSSAKAIAMPNYSRQLLTGWPANALGDSSNAMQPCVIIKIGQKIPCAAGSIFSFDLIRPRANPSAASPLSWLGAIRLRFL